MQRTLVNTHNPLFLYKERTGLTWREIKEKTGMSYMGIFEFIRKKPKDLMLCRLETAWLFKKYFDIDILEYLMENYKG